MSIQSQYFAPDDRLKPYITGYIWNEISIDQHHQTVDLFPVGHCVLSFAFDDLPLHFEGRRIITRHNITGQLTQSFKMQAVKGEYKTLMVLLKPYGAYRFFACHQESIVNTYCSINDIDATFSSISKHLHAQSTISQRIEIIERWLNHKLTVEPIPPLFAVTQVLCDDMLMNNGHAELQELYHKIPYSVSTIERYFKKYVGITPKKLNRILRFNYAYTMINKGNYHSWMDIALGHGYFDQAHFIKEFKSFYGYTPTQLHQSIFNIAGHVSSLESEL